MEVTAAARALLALRDQTVAESDWEHRRNELRLAIRSSDAADDLRATLELDSSDLLPVDLKSEIYERLLAVGGRVADTLRRYAWHLQLHGPEWDDKAETLLAEAEQRETR
jgi:hypothetical protein